MKTHEIENLKNALVYGRGILRMKKGNYLELRFPLDEGEVKFWVILECSFLEGSPGNQTLIGLYLESRPLALRGYGFINPGDRIKFKHYHVFNCKATTPFARFRNNLAVYFAPKD